MTAGMAAKPNIRRQPTLSGSMKAANPATTGNGKNKSVKRAVNFGVLIIRSVCYMEWYISECSRESGLLIGTQKCDI